jgi:DNA (cytosine-5)-methyltransferase 1
VKPTFYEFFAGGGMARAGLSPDWQCTFANDFDRKKATSYQLNWGENELWVGDVHELPHSLDRFPDVADLAWASFPCQDLSLAGNLSGLSGARSSAFWGFHDVLYGLKLTGRLPRSVVVENVLGLLTANGGSDFHQVCKSLDLLGYNFGALVMDARHFLPQSRPRLFLLAILKSNPLPSTGISESARNDWTNSSLNRAFSLLPLHLKSSWRWWNVAPPPTTRPSLDSQIESQPKDVDWHTKSETDRLLSMMSEPSKARLNSALATGKRVVGTAYRRTRPDPTGFKSQRTELRMDGVAGCLRTPGGGSSRQFVVIAENGIAKSRLLSARETARLMGLPDEYILPSNYNEAYHLAGDGLAVPVVRHLGQFILSHMNFSNCYSIAAE